MTEDKNSKSKTRKEEYVNHDDDYMFMREVIKPRKKEIIFKKILGILVTGILVGLIAVITFICVWPYVQEYIKPVEDEIPKVEFPDDDYEDVHGENQEGQNSSGNLQNPQNSEQTDENNPTPPHTGDGNTSPEITPTVCPERLTLEGFRQVYQEIVDVAEATEKALVVVQGISSEVDWMNNSYENKTQVSGVLVAENTIYYYVLTEYRVVEKVERIMITFSNGSTALADFVKHDPGTGLAVLRIPKRDLSKKLQSEIQIATLGSSWKIKRGETVIAIGSPTGYSGSIAYGMVTSTNNVIATIDKQYHLLTTDILGDSEGSGVMISLDGEIVGVMLQSFSMEKNQNVLTAIPISEVKQVIEDLINDEELIYFGIMGQDITAELSKNTDIPLGVYINSVEKDSPAMLAGIKNGDVIVGVGDVPIETLRQFMSALHLYEDGEKITVNVMRKGAEDYVQIVFDVVLGAL